MTAQRALYANSSAISGMLSFGHRPEEITRDPIVLFAAGGQVLSLPFH